MAEVGELEPWFNRRTKRMEWRLVLPTHCRNGHALVADVIHLTHRGCLCRGRGGHTLVICMTCGDEQELPSCLTPLEAPDATSGDPQSGSPAG